MQKLYLKKRVLYFYLIACLLLGTGLVNQVFSNVHFQHADTTFDSLPLEVRMLNKELNSNLLFEAISNNTEDENYFLPDTIEVLSVQQNPRRFTYLYNNYAKKTVTKSWRFENGAWVWYAYTSFSYDDLGNLTSEVTAERPADTWINVSKLTMTYEGNGLLKTLLKQFWDGSAWQNDEKYTNTWNSNGYLVAELKEVWSESGWSADEFEIYVRNDDGSFLEYTKQIWNGSNWVNAAHIVNEFDNGLVQTSMYQTGVNNEWINAEKFDYLYNDLNQNTSYTISSWENDQWEDAYRYTYTYNDFGNVDSGLLEIWLDGVWVNQEYGLYTLDGFGSIQSALMQEWVNDAWTNLSLKTFNYDADGNAVEGDYYKWSNDSWSQIADVQLMMRYDHGIYQTTVYGYHAEASYFNILVGNSEYGTELSASLDLYPNPARETLYMEINHAQKVQFIQILNASGRVFKEVKPVENVNYPLKFKVSLHDMPNGVYIVRSFDGILMNYQKLIISK